MKAIKPIRTKKNHAAALQEIEKLWNCAPGSADFDRLEVLSTMVSAYEESDCPIDPPDPIEAIKFRMEQMGLSRKDLESYVGSRARVSEILGRKRGLTLPMIRRLHAALGIPAEILLAG
jgi:HTH-type transcriptional regulator/antitoxin HigA